MLCQDELRVANLGDCGVSIIRKDDYLFRSEEQQHSFNFPYQLGTASFDYPSDAQQFSVKIEEGDVLIVASDGLYDNLFDDEILEEVQACIRDCEQGQSIPQLISESLSQRAKIVSEDINNPASPFQSRAMHEGMYYQVRMDTNWKVSKPRGCLLKRIVYAYDRVARRMILLCWLP